MVERGVERSALTCPTAWPSRILALSPFVYLGKISYALYLVQMAPLGLREFLVRGSEPPWLRVLVLYAGMSAASALLYEAVEKPARRFILSMRPATPARDSPAAH